MKVYLNGSEIGSYTAPQDIVYDGTQHLRLSRWGGGRYWNGQVDELEIFDRALSRAEIQAIYNAGSAGKCQIYTLTVNKTFYLSNDNILDGSDILIKTSYVWYPINPGSYRNVRFYYHSRISLTGKYIIAVIDSLNQIAEANETNNNVPYGPLP